MSYRKNLEMIINGRYAVYSADTGRVNMQNDAKSQPTEWDAYEIGNIPAQGADWTLTSGYMNWYYLAQSVQFVPPFACRLTKISWSFHYDLLNYDTFDGMRIGMFAATVPDTPPDWDAYSVDSSTTAIRCVGRVDTPENPSTGTGYVEAGSEFITGSGRDIAAGEACFIGVESLGTQEADNLNMILTLTFEVI